MLIYPSGNVRILWNFNEHLQTHIQEDKLVNIRLFFPTDIVLFLNHLFCLSVVKQTYLLGLRYIGRCFLLLNFLFFPLSQRYFIMMVCRVLVVSPNLPYLLTFIFIILRKLMSYLLISHLSQVLATLRG